MTTNIVIAIITAYTSSQGAICSNGHTPTQHYTIAAPRNIPIGSRILIEGIPTVFTVEDRTARKYNGRFDIYMDSREYCFQFGKQTLKVTIITQ